MEMVGKIQGWRNRNPRSRFAGLGITVLLHVLALAALLQFEHAQTMLSQTAPIMVSLISPQPVVEKPQVLPKPLPVRPKAVQPVPPEPRQLITAAAEMPSPAQAPSTPATPLQATPPPQTAAPAAAAPVIPPNFNADYLDNPAPSYPALSRRLGEQGRVTLRVLVNAQGTPEKIELRASSGVSRLDEAALDVVRRWRFVPARQGDQPVAAWVLIPITFTLKG
jgi:protein TonB